jgi:hypothetical protein
MPRPSRSGQVIGPGDKMSRRTGAQLRRDSIGPADEEGEFGTSILPLRGTRRYARPMTNAERALLFTSNASAISAIATPLPTTLWRPRSSDAAPK